MLTDMKIYFDPITIAGLAIAGVSAGLSVSEALDKPDAPGVPGRSDAEVQAAALAERRRRAAAAGRSSTQLTGPLGLGATGGTIGRKTALGQ